MKALVVPSPEAGVDNVTVVDIAIPKAQEGLIQLRVEAVSLNPVDWKLAEAKLPLRYPHGLGLDVAGTVESIGEGVSGWQIGDRALAHANIMNGGAFAEFVVVPAHASCHIPDGISFAAAASLPCAGWTAYLGLFRKAHLQEGQSILVQGANGGVGGFAVQLAKSVNAKVIALTKPEHFEKIKELGADVVLDYRDPELKAKVLAETEDGLGVHVYLEVASPGDAVKSMECVRFNGHLLCVHKVPDLTQLPPFQYCASVHEVGLGYAYRAGDMASQRDFKVVGDAMLGMLVEGKLDPMITETITFEEIQEGLQRLKRREIQGKLVANIGGKAWN